MAPSRRLAALVVIAALSLAACASRDAKRSDVVDAMTDAGLTTKQADCIGDGFFHEGQFASDSTQFTQKQLNDLGSASSAKDFPSGTQKTVDSIIEKCTGKTKGGSGSSSPSTESTTTTAG